MNPPASNDTLSRSAPRAIRLVLRALLVLIVCHLSIQVGHANKFPPHNISALWPTSAILVAVLVSSPIRHWWAYFVAGYSAYAIDVARAGFQISDVLYNVADIIKVLIAAVGVRQYAGGLRAFDSLNGLLRYITFAVLLAPVISAFVAAIAGGGRDYWFYWRAWCLSEALAFLMLAPAILTWTAAFRAARRSFSTSKFVEAGILACGLLAVSIGVFAWTTANQSSIPLLVYLPLPFLLWAAVRFGPVGVSTALLIVACASISGAVRGRGPFGASGSSDNVLALQLFLMTISIPHMFLAALIVEARQKTVFLSESEARFRSMADSTPVMIWMSGPDKLCTYFNKGWLDFTGRSLAQELGNGWSEGVHPDELAGCMVTYVTAFDARREFSMEYRMRRHDGEYRWIWDRGVPRFALDGTFFGYIGCVDDISERKQAEHALLASESRYRTLLESANDAIFLITEVDDIIAVNQRACDLLGYSRQELLAMKVTDLQASEVQGQPGTVIKSELAQYQDRPFESLGVRRDGNRIPVEITNSVIDENGRRLVLQIVRDVTERRRAEQELRESEHELQRLSGQLLQAQETERRRIARELHDDLNQDLSLLSVELDLLGQKPPISTEQLRATTRELSAHVKQLSFAVHALSHQLHPAKLEQLGLVSSLRSLCKEISQGYGLTIEFSQKQVPQETPFDVTLCLYRIAQEALQNVIKHSGASRAELGLFGDDRALTLQITDNGTGFDAAQASVKEGLGLLSMRERLRSLRGDISIVRRPTGGTQIDVKIPLGSPSQAEGCLKL